jgi:hypothetical protein
MADTEIVIQAQSTAFSRHGNTWHRKGFTYQQPWIGNALSQGLLNSTPWNDTAAFEQGTLRRILDPTLFDETVIPGGISLKNVQSIPWSAFNGADKLELIYNKDPWSTEYEDETKALYERSYLKARTVAASGPGNVRGGTARAAFEMVALDVEMSNNRFREIWQVQMALAQLVTTAVNIAADKEAARWGLILQGQQQQAATEQGRLSTMLQAAGLVEQMRESNARLIPMAAELFGNPLMWVEEHLDGYQQQGSAQTTFGMNYWR